MADTAIPTSIDFDDDVALPAGESDATPSLPSATDEVAPLAKAPTGGATSRFSSGFAAVAGGLAALRAKTSSGSTAPAPAREPTPSARLRTAAALEGMKDHDLPPPVYTLRELVRIPLALSWLAALANTIGFLLVIPAYIVPWYTVTFASVDPAREKVITTLSFSLIDTLYQCSCPTCFVYPPARPLDNDCFPSGQRFAYYDFLVYWFGTFNPDSPYPPGGVDAVGAAVAFVTLGAMFSLAASFSIMQEIAASRATIDLPPWRRLLCHLLPEPKWTGTAVASQALCATAFSCSLLGCLIGWTAIPAFSNTLTGLNTLIFWGAGGKVPVNSEAGATIAAMLCVCHFVAMAAEVARKFFLRRVAREDPGNKYPMLKLCGGAHDEMGWCA